MIQDKARLLSDFLDFLRDQGIHLAKYRDYEDEEGALTTELVSIGSETFYNELLAKFFDIDLAKVEAEQRKMLDEIRKK